MGGVATEGGASATVAKTAMAARCARAPLRTPGRVCPRLRASLPVALPDHTLVLGSAGRGARQRQPSSKAADALEGTAVGAKRNAGCDVGGISLSSASAGSSRAADNALERENKRPRNAEEPVVLADVTGLWRHGTLQAPEGQEPVQGPSRCALCGCGLLHACSVLALSDASCYAG